MPDENTVRNDAFPAYVGFLSVFYIVPAYTGDKGFVFFWCCFMPGTATGESSVFGVFCAVIGQVLKAKLLLAADKEK